jgi:CheY-like chemotaxis protein
MASVPVLIVDDNPMNLKLERTLLEIENYKVLTAKNAEDALETLKNFTPKLILMDLQMPDVDGVELTRRLKSDPQTRMIKILMLTSYGQMGDEKRALEAGCDGYIFKPIDTKTFPGIVADCLHRDPNHPQAGS